MVGPLGDYAHGDGMECSEGVPSLELTENAFTGGLRCRNTVGSKLGCRRACLLRKHITLYNLFENDNGFLTIVVLMAHPAKKLYSHSHFLFHSVTYAANCSRSPPDILLKNVE